MPAELLRHHCEQCVLWYIPFDAMKSWLCHKVLCLLKVLKQTTTAAQVI